MLSSDQYLNAKFGNKNSIFSIINDYLSSNMFEEAFQYFNSKKFLFLENEVNYILYEFLNKYFNSRKNNLYKNTPLVITWSTTPKNVPFLFMSDPKIRLYENILGLAAWILDGTFSNIIIIDNTELNLNKDKLKKIGFEFNKEIDFYSFEASYDKISKFGKGYGEGEILKFAIDNVEQVYNTTNFVKMNGKQYVPFFEFYFSNELKEFFNLHYIANKFAIDTRFYNIKREYYYSNLIDAYKEVNDHEERYLEHVVYEKTLDRTNFFIPFEPFVLGKQGSINKNYGDYPKIIHEFANKIIKNVIQ